MKIYKNDEIVNEEAMYEHGTEIIITSLEELKMLVENMPDGVELNVEIDEEGYYG